MTPTCQWDRLRRGVHPACIGLGKPFTYIRALWEEGFGEEGPPVGPGEQDYIRPEEWGLRLQALGMIGNRWTIQMIREVKPEAGKLITVAARIRLDHAPTQRFWFGLWPAELDPVKNGLDDGVFFRQAPGIAEGSVAVHGGIFSDGVGGYTADPLFDTINDVMYDLAIVLHGTTMVDHIWQRYVHDNPFDATRLSWDSFPSQSNIPTISMRPSFVCHNLLAIAAGGMHVRGFVVRETTLRE
jgi:hypothetical protein